jgi:hypothetical protein
LLLKTPMNNDWPIQPTFAFATYPEYLDAITEVEGGVIGEGSARNLVRFQCSAQFLRGLVTNQQLRSWAVVKGNRIEHLRYSASDLVAYGLRVGWFHSFSDLGLQLLTLREDLFLRLKAENKPAETGEQPDWFSDAITIKRVVSEPEPADLPDFLLGLLLARGNGSLEAEARRWDNPIPWSFTRQGADTSEVLHCCLPDLFRHVLAGLATKVGTPFQQSGHTFFTVRYAGEVKPCPGRFSFYLSNTSLSGYWAKLYLYDVLPKPEATMNPQ